MRPRPLAAAGHPAGVHPGHRQRHHGGAGLPRRPDVLALPGGRPDRSDLVGQAVVFGVAHTGSDFVASPLPVVLAIVAGGLIAGLIVRRTGSLWLAIVVHIAFDVPLYYAAACRL